MSNELGVCILPKPSAIYRLERQLLPALNPQLPAQRGPGVPCGPPHTPHALHLPLTGSTRLRFFLLLKKFLFSVLCSAGG